MKTDIEIARETKMKHIVEIAKQLKLSEDDIEMYGKYKAKIPLNFINETKAKKSKLVLVTAITPTPAGEGKTTTSIGLAQGLNQLGKQTTVVLREPSLGPVFGIKGGAAGGGKSQVLPMEDINLHFTGDLSAIEKAHNLLSALIDNNLQNKKYSLNLDPRRIAWRRVIDMNERALRNIIIGLGGEKQGMPRETGFDITAASEVMATLCLSKDLQDLKERLGNIFVGYTFDDKPIYARDLKAHGAMAALLKDAIKPNLVQTIEGTPAIIHGGPFANIAQGTNSLIATKMGLSLSDYVVTEAGFASELGAEKFFDIKSQYGNLNTNAVVIVATVRALKYHGGVKVADLKTPNTDALEKGLPNLDKHIENMTKFGFKPVVAVNKFPTDTDDELNMIISHCKIKGIKVALSDVWSNGGKGAKDLALLVDEAINDCDSCFKPLYDFKDSIEEKIDKVTKELYGAKNVEYTVLAKKQIKEFTELGYGNLPVCIAKTQKSLSDDPHKKGRPENFTVKVRQIELNSGAGFIVPIAGTIMRMPGLPSVPASENMDIDENGNITGLF